MSLRIDLFGAGARQLLFSSSMETAMRDVFLGDRKNNITNYVKALVSHVFFAMQC